MDGKQTSSAVTNDWVKEELADILDEDYELELSQPALSLALREVYREHRPPTMGRFPPRGIASPFRH